MKYLDHALEIDGENVEGLVARGALWVELKDLIVVISFS